LLNLNAQTHNAHARAHATHICIYSSIGVPFYVTLAMLMCLCLCRVRYRTW